MMTTQNKVNPPEAIIITMPVIYFLELGQIEVNRIVNYHVKKEGLGNVSPERRKRLARNYTKKQKILLGYGEYLREMNKVINNEEYYWVQKISSIPTFNILYCYITVFGRIMFRANIGGYENGGWVKTAAGQKLYSKHWMILTHPFVRAPEKIERRGFQGFRYSGLLF